MVDVLITRKNKTIMYIKIVNMLMFFAIIGMFGSTSLLAQEQDKELSYPIVSGKVVNSDGQPMPNVFIKSFEAKGKSISNSDGVFSIQVAEEIDQIIIDKEGYLLNVTEIIEGNFTDSTIVLLVEGEIQNAVAKLPYQSFSNNRSVSSTYTLTGDELASYPASNFLETLSGRIPGLKINTFSNGATSNLFFSSATGGISSGEPISATIRGESVSFYIDGIQRDPSDLNTYEIETVQVIKDMAGRAALGLSGYNPVIWITTKTGKKFKKDISVSTESGLSTPTSQPEYLDAYNYASLYNEALTNDGLAPLYSAQALAAYQNGTDPIYYPNVDYYNDYVKKSSKFQRANVNFSGGDEKVNYFSLLDYVQTNGLEKIGETTVSNRFKARGGVNIQLTDKIEFRVNISGTFQEQTYPNQDGGSSSFDLFNFIASNPANAHAISYDDKYIVSADYPLNIENELRFGGYAKSVNLNSQNSASLLLDLGGITKGLTFTGTAAFDVYSNVTTNKGGTADLYRLSPDYQLVRTQEATVVPNLNLGNDLYSRNTTAFLHVNYDRVFDKHALTMNTAYYAGLVEYRGFANYQPIKKQDLSYRANYAYDDTYVVQLDLAYTGSMKLPDGKRYNLYPTVGAAWVASNESFLSSSKMVNYLKLFSSYGIVGNDNFRTGFNSNYNPYYLNTTLWQNVGGWQSGIEGNRGAISSIFNIQQEGSANYELPKMSYLNVGVQSELFKKTVSFELNYFNQVFANDISQRSSLTPSIFGSGSFLPLTNYGKTKYWGLEGYVQYTNKIGDLEYSLGGNAQYRRGSYVDVDEPAALEAYRKYAGTDVDAFRGYQAEGLYQSQAEIDARGVNQSWGAVQPGDIRYTDYNNDGVVDEKDIFNTGDHAPRVYYGTNLKLKYKSFGLIVIGQGIADGVTQLNGNYFRGNNPRQNYAVGMLDRFPATNNLPRLTTQSQNNFQGSSFWLENAAYFTIKNIEFSYTMPKSIATNMSLPNLKFFVRGKNIASFSKFSKYNLDPESTSAGISLFPIFRTFTLGASCKF